MGLFSRIASAARSVVAAARDTTARVVDTVTAPFRARAPAPPPRSSARPTSTPPAPQAPPPAQQQAPTAPTIIDEVDAEARADLAAELGPVDVIDTIDRDAETEWQQFLAFAESRGTSPEVIDAIREARLRLRAAGLIEDEIMVTIDVDQRGSTL